MKATYPLLAIFAVIIALTSCSSGTSYAELLSDENKAVNAFLANNRVIPYQQRDSTFVFETGATAPYYELDEEGNVYMQVLNSGTPGYRAYEDQLIYFRFTRYNLESATDGELVDSSGDPLGGEGNSDDLTYGSSSFRYLNSSDAYTWGTGLQLPLYYLPIDCEVNIVIKSQYGLYSEIANVIPYLYNVRYFKSQI